MKKRILASWSVVLLMLLSWQNSSYAAVIYTFQPTPAELSDLPHQHNFKWGINWNLPSGEQVISATLTYKNIYDWRVETDHLYTHFLNSAPVGVSSGWDNEGGGDYFLGQGLLLGDWDDPVGGYARNFDLIYNVPAGYFNWLSDGNFGFGIDPDCHYYNDGIRFKITTTPIPEPASLSLLGLGLLGLIGKKRRRGK